MDVLEVEQTEGPYVEIPWIKLSGHWRLRPIEFKHGKPKDHNADLIQLCAQALCLEEMTGLPVNEGSIFYCELRRRTEFEFDEDIRTETIELPAKEAHLFIWHRSIIHQNSEKIKLYHCCVISFHLKKALLHFSISS